MQSKPVLPIPYDFVNWTRGNDVEEWGPHAPRDEFFLEWRWLTAVLNGSDGQRYFLYSIFEPAGRGFVGPINKEVNGSYSTDKPICSVFYRLTNMDTGETIAYHQEYTDRGHNEIFNAASNTWQYESKAFSSTLSYTGEQCRMTASDNQSTIDITALNPTGKPCWYFDPTIGKEGFMREGGGVTLYYSCPNMPLYGHFTKVDEKGVRNRIEFTGRGWLDNQVCDLKKIDTARWEWTGLLFADGDRVNLYNFFDDNLQICHHFHADGRRDVQYGGFTQKQNAYTKLETGVWVSYGWDYEIPVKGKKYKAVPYYPNQMPGLGVPGGMLETLCALYDESGKQVGYATTESMDVRMLLNGPNGPRQIG